MADFKSVFKQIFDQKKKYVHLVLLVQLFAVVFLTIFMVITNHTKDDSSLSLLVGGVYGTWWELPFGLMISLTILSDIVFAGIMSWQNEKINLSQTWRQIPISDSKLFSANVLSSMIACAYIFTVQVIVTCLCYIPSAMHEKKNFLVEIWNGLGVGTNRFNGWLEELLAIIGLAFVVFAFVSFADLSSRAIIETLPVKQTKWIRMLVTAILVIVAAYIYISVDNQVQNHIFAYYDKNYHEYIPKGDPVWITVIEIFVAGSICSCFNYWLINRYVEPKIVNR